MRNRNERPACRPRLLGAWTLLALCALPMLRAADDTQVVVEKAVGAVGGKDRLLTLFRVHERLAIGSDPAKAGNERVSVIEPPRYWWMGKRERVKDEKEPAIFLVWAWTLGALSDPSSKIALLPDIVDQEEALTGLRVSGSIEPALDMYFDKATYRLRRIDWRSDTHRFSAWREHDGLSYPSKCIGYRKTGRPWYFSEITSIERLSELPEGLKR